MNTKLKIVDDQPKEEHSHCSPTLLNVEPGKHVLSARGFKGRACIVTLGCAKNQVDSEVMLGSLIQGGYDIVTDASQAELIIINTCGFLESSVKESIDRILEAADYKNTGRCRQLLVAGCMVERYRGDLTKEIPEVDRFVSLDDIVKIGQIAEGEHESILDRAARPYFLYDDTMPRLLSTPRHTAYVKIAEGCNRPCTFCIIPKIRGAMRSREVDSIVREVKDLGSRGVKEVNYIAQDLTSYGTDRKGPRLAQLLEQVDKSGAVKWQRLLYAYPIGVDEELLDAIVSLPTVAEYIDIPLQHSSLQLLKAMQRPLGKFSPRSLVEKMRSYAPSIHIRTTFIVGFPGETEEDVSDLESFIRDGHFSSVGVFKYSREEGTPAHDMDNQISDREKQSRYDRLMQAQQDVMGARLDSLVGQKLEVLVEGTHPDTDLLLSGRSRFQAPEIDGTVIINDIDPEVGEVHPGEIREVEVTEIAGYDLIGKVISGNAQS